MADIKLPPFHTVGEPDFVIIDGKLGDGCSFRSVSARKGDRYVRRDDALEFAERYARAAVEAYLAGRTVKESLTVRLPMTIQELAQLAREAQIAFCLNKYASFEEALARAVEAHHGIKEAS